MAEWLAQFLALLALIIICVGIATYPGRPR